MESFLPPSSGDMPGRRAVTLADIDVTGEIAKATGRMTQSGPRHERHVVKSQRWFRWRWFLLDSSVLPIRTIAEGTAFSERRGWRKVDAANHAELDRIARQRKADDGGCE